MKFVSDHWLILSLSFVAISFVVGLFVGRMLKVSDSRRTGEYGDDVF